MNDNAFERRHDDRRYAMKFLDYEVIDSNGEIVGRGLARTLNVSENGLRLETGQFLEPGSRLRITLGLDEDLVQVVGRVMHAEPETDELASAGVMFVEFSEEERRGYMRHYQALKRAVVE
ncbi:MAG: hypothetical protein C0614_09185 [Desulfuromonas sp.]|nr:MAG: hypothetical protein C0614_09185 [Desulfuromonas sp.]